VCARYVNGWLDGQRMVCTSFFFGMGNEACRFVSCRLPNTVAAVTRIRDQKMLVLVSIKRYLRYDSMDKGAHFNEFQSTPWVLKDIETVENVGPDPESGAWSVSMGSPGGVTRIVPFTDMVDRMCPELVAMQ